ncbi:MAG: ATP-binding cassette domain-containing protein [bacterium]
MNPQTLLAIEAKNITRNFQGKLAVDNLSLEIKQGEIYAFLGPNGAGKSTTVKILITLLEPTSGSGSILGHDIITDSGEVRLLIGVALQEASLDESQTGVEFLRLQGSLYGLTKTQIQKRIDDLIPLIDIGDALKKQIKTYSGGMKRRLDLAASIIHNPKILFLDEPTTGLDPISRAKVWEEVNRLNKELGMTIFLTTQYLEEADQLADRVGIISGGKLVAQGTPKELKNSIGNDVIIALIDSINQTGIDKLKLIPEVTKVDFKDKELVISTKSGSNTIGKVAVELNNLNIKLESLTLRTTTLDDVFLEVTGNRLNNKELN